MVPNVHFCVWAARGSCYEAAGFFGQGEWAAGAAPSEMAKQISLFAIWQKKACPEDSG